MFENSRILYDRATKVIPGGVNSPIRFFNPFPFFAAYANGSKVTSSDHISYVDYCMGYGSLLLGHAYTEVLEAVKLQLDSGSLYCIPTEKEVRLGEMNAVRLARGYTKKNKVIKFEGCYHGAQDYSLVNIDTSGHSAPSSSGIPKEFSSETIVVPFNDFAQLEEVIRKRNDISCVILEPIPANMGLVVPEKEYLNFIRKITLEKDIVLIFDEVVTGFRLGTGGASEFFGIKPDIVTFSKSVANGFSLATICGRRELLEQFAPTGDVYQASTYAGNPVAVTAAIATISALTRGRNQIYPRMTRVCDSLIDGIRDVARDRKIPCRINSFSSMYQLFFTTREVRDMMSAKTSDLDMFNALFTALLEKGVFIPPSQFETCFLSYAHADEDIDRTVEAYDYAFHLMRSKK
jgi:glutamate-1-semialdehyde 2,1-aminomutase